MTINALFYGSFTMYLHLSLISPFFRIHHVHFGGQKEAQRVVKVKLGSKVAVGRDRKCAIFS